MKLKVLIKKELNNYKIFSPFKEKTRNRNEYHNRFFINTNKLKEIVLLNKRMEKSKIKQIKI